MSCLRFLLFLADSGTPGTPFLTTKTFSLWPNKSLDAIAREKLAHALPATFWVQKGGVVLEIPDVPKVFWTLASIIQNGRLVIFKLVLGLLLGNKQSLVKDFDDFHPVGCAFKGRRYLVLAINFSTGVLVGEIGNLFCVLHHYFLLFYIFCTFSSKHKSFQPVKTLTLENDPP